MGDGRVSLILDVPAIAGECFTRDESEEHMQTGADAEARELEAEPERLLLMSVGENRRVGVSLEKITRLEEFQVADVRRGSKHDVVQYRGGILPLIDVASAIEDVRSEFSRDRIHVLVQETDKGAVGFVINQILDIVEDRIHPTVLSASGFVRGTTVVRDEITDIVDLESICAAKLGEGETER